ncbi:general transcription factor 3C polypeptide 3 [Phlebotomus argentipes]|uniref:general transcription factor 3C polypeptide 3 n=1 Tax=Phlebotomus argentipes TaxID=94469 RepID=UPI0028931635|nr:general transcription factor 3C polypeptide 3 [Phlebotomus argentipes]
MASTASTSKIVEDVIIEEIDSATLNEEELSKFVPLEPIKVEQLPPRKPLVSSIEEEEELIKQLVNGELSFSEYSERMGTNTEDIGAEEDAEEGNQGEAFEKELMMSRRDAFRGQLSGTTMKDGRLYRRRKCILPPALQGLMGEANLCYARGDNELAKKVCLEIIRQVPLAAEPFHTLAQIYEMTDTEKCMQFMLIAAHLDPGDTHHWMRLSELSEEAGNMKQAVFCLTKALKYDPRNFELRLKRIELLEKMGEDRFVLQCYFTMISYIPENQGEYLLSVAKKVAHKFHQENNCQKALEAMRRAYEKIPNLFTTADLNLLLELLMMQGMYEKAVEILCNHTDARVTVIKGKVTNCVIPESLIIDFRTKLSVSLIHLQVKPFIDLVIENILKYVNVEVDGDCVLEVAEALMLVNEYEKALKLLDPLVYSQNFSYAEVWLRHGDCYRAMARHDDAINSYRMVVSLAPTHLDARLTLSALLKLKNQPQEALKALEQDLESDLIDPKLLYERCFMLKETGNLELYVDLSYILFSRHCVKYRNREEVEVAAFVQTYSQKITSIKELRQVRLENMDDADGPEFTKSTEEPTIEEEWTLFCDVVRTVGESKRYDVMEKITLAALTSKRFQSHIKDIGFMCLLACLLNRDTLIGYYIVKEFLMKNLHEARAWNLFNVMNNNSDEVRANRFLQRLLNRHGNELDPRTSVLRANYWLASGTYKYALNDYMSLYMKTKNPMNALLVGVTFLQLGSQKFGNRPMYLKQGITFMDEYVKKREPEAAHEVWYNMGRFYQQIGIHHVAVSYYKKVLQHTSDMIRQHPHIVDLKRATAYNLHLIYKESRNYDLARFYLYNYIVV